MKTGRDPDQDCGSVSMGGAYEATKHRIVLITLHGHVVASSSRPTRGVVARGASCPVNHLLATLPPTEADHARKSLDVVGPDRRSLRSRHGAGRWAGSGAGIV